MRAINHAMTGAIIGLSLTNPVALPLALVSHYVLDSLPHHGGTSIGTASKSFKLILFLDIGLCVALVIVLGLRHPTYWWLAVLCAFLAASPDFMWFEDFIHARHGEPRRDPRQRHQLVRLHSWIQWFERPIGLVVEAVWAAAAIVLLIYLSRT